MEENKQIRAFIAIDLPRKAISEIREIQELIRKQNLFYGKFIEPENLHLTLKFLGEIDEEKIKEVGKKLTDIKIGKFKVRIGNAGVFSRDVTRIIWVKLKGKEIFELQKEIDEKLGDLFLKEERFMGHITIARVKNIPDRKEFLNYLKGIKTKSLEFPVEDFVLKKSELKSAGPDYEDIERYELL